MGDALVNDVGEGATYIRIYSTIVFVRPDYAGWRDYSCPYKRNVRTFMAGQFSTARYPIIKLVINGNNGDGRRGSMEFG